MSVLINGMKMPTSCWECHFGHGDSGICVVDFKQHGDWSDPQNCPLIPVPPHGRLIDLDAIPKEAWRGEKEDLVDELILAPTIIEAEEGE